MSFRPSAGRRIRVKKNPVTARDLLRRHLREEGMRIAPDLSTAWKMHPTSAYRRMYEMRPFTPQMIDAAVELLKLDEFDANELRKRAANEAGWQIDYDLERIRD